MPANMLPDAPLDTFLGGRYGLPYQGLRAPKWARNPTIDVSMTPTAAPAVDYEKVVLADPVTNKSVLVITAIDPATGIPTPTAYNMDGSPYVGPIAALTAPDTPDLEADPVSMCDGGNVSFLRWFTMRDGTITGTFDTSIAGLPYLPLGAVTEGSCAAPTKPKFLYTKSNIAATLTMADLFGAMTGATVLHSISVTQITGTGTLTGHTGGGFSLYAGETQTWDAEEFGMESLHFSNLTLTAGTGEQHITAIYTV